MQERHLKQFWEQLVLGGLLRGYRDEWYSSFSSGLRVSNLNFPYVTPAFSNCLKLLIIDNQ